MNQAVPIFEYVFQLNKSMFHVELELDYNNRIVKSGFYLADSQEESEIKNFLRNTKV